MGLRAIRQAERCAAAPDETIEMTIEKQNGAVDGFNRWTLNGEAFSMETMKPITPCMKGAAIG